MLLTKIVEGLIRLFGGAPFDESTHPMDGGIFAAIMDLDCFNGVRGGKAAARKRRKRDSRALQRNVSVAGSLTTQMMLDKHSQGVERQGYPLLEQRRGNYSALPRNTSIDQLGRADYGHRPSLSDQGSMQSERLTDESHGRILDAWKPAMYDGQPPVTPSEKSIKRQSWGGPPPAIRVTDEPGMHHARGRSSSAIMEELASTAGSISPPLRSVSTTPHVDYNSFAPPPSAYPPPRTDKEGRALRPPPLSIPRRRSLNNISVEDHEQVRAAAKRRSWGSSHWFARGGPRHPDDSDSEDEHNPPADPYDDVPGRPHGCVPSSLVADESWMRGHGMKSSHARRLLSTRRVPRLLVLLLLSLPVAVAVASVSIASSSRRLVMPLLACKEAAQSRHHSSRLPRRHHSSASTAAVDHLASHPP